MAEQESKRNMLTVTLDIVGIAPLGFSSPIQSPKLDGEMHDAYEERTWRERMHVDEKGECFIPPMALKNCLSEAAKFRAETIKGEGKATYTKHFEAGIMVVDRLMLGVKAKDVQGLRLFVPSDGKRGGGKRVWKTFPKIDQWRTSATLHILDDKLIQKPEKVEEYLGFAGKMIGMGFSRPRNNGYFGRFVIENFRVVSAE